MVTSEKNSSEALPKWMMRKYAQLWRIFKEKEFTAEDAVDKLKEDKKIILVVLSNWRKMGWLNVDFDKKDARKRIYSLKNPEKVIEVMENHNKTNKSRDNE